MSERDAYRPSVLWKQISPERRLAVARSFWSDPDAAAEQAEAVLALAQHRKFRPQTVTRLPSDRKARYLASMLNLSDAIAARALVAYHLECQRPMMGRFLDELGIPHEDGLITQDEMDPPDAARLSAAAREIGAGFPADDVRLYLWTLVCQDPDTWASLKDLQELGHSARPPVT